jgi:hypothetical protein
MQWTILAVSETERAKADANPNYSPNEEIVGELEASCLRMAITRLAKLVRKGKYPVGSVVQPGD